MRVLKRNPWLAGLGALLVFLVASPPKASADVTINRGSSILVFPKVIADGTRDTLIQISNTSNSLIFVQCFYAFTQPAEGSGGVVLVERGFDFALTRQQPTVWRVSTGRVPNVFANLGACQETMVGNALRQECPGFQIEVPNVAPFQGELKCWQVDVSGAPVGGNALKGEAIIEGPATNATANISAYNAIGIIGISVDQDPTLNLDDSEYNACPASLAVTHLAQGVPDPVADNDELQIESELTMVPCTENFLTQVCTPVTVQFQSYDEFESPASVSTLVDCWYNETLSDLEGPVEIFDASRGSTVLHTVLRPSSGSGSGILAVLEEFRVTVNGTGVRTGSAAANMVAIGSRTSGDAITDSNAGQCDLPGGGGSLTPCYNTSQCTITDEICQ